MSSALLFRTPTFLPWLASRFFSSLARQILVVVVAWRIWELTHSPLALGLIGFSDAVPYVISALWAGHAADRYDKKRLIVGAEAGLTLCTGALLFLMYSRPTAVVPIYLLLGVSSIMSSFEGPSTSSYLQMLVPPEHYSRAVAWNLTEFQIATIAGPLLGGVLLKSTGAVFSLGIVVALYGLAACCSSFLKSMRSTEAPSQESAWESVRAGLKFLLTRRIIYACMILDMLAVLFGDVISILPVFATLFGAGPIGFGFLRAAPAIGSCLTSLMEATRPFIRVKWATLLRVVTIFGLCIIAFSLSKNIWLAFFFLVLGGMADGVSVIVRQSTYQSNTPNNLRGRVASVSGLSIRVSNELGGFESGLAAQFIGAVPTAFFGGIITLLIVAGMKLKFRNLDDNP
jgi:MFS family permease